MSYCLEKSQSLFKVKNDIKPMLLADEDILLDTATNCIELAVRPYRHALINKFIRMSYPIVSSKETTLSFQGQMCRFTLKKVENKNQEEVGVSLGQKIDLKKLEESSKALSTREILVSEGRVGVLDIDSTSLYAKCAIFANKIEIEVSLSSKFDQSLSTTVVIDEGEWLNISSIKEDLSSKDKSLSLQTGLSRTKKEGEKSIAFYISVKK